ncbi:LamG-like jellyroll fold domain-containing protein [Archangium violaceum]|uniref:LamG-like jellyroll fold domain-containing protein n=1 Tax=Archangium violaceum Cb vi76 TaxID=1406225 RepID=A0A084T289_9BACT|nr:LamG-like jellyroll fold domain-containing protein [Archangium violaceum]KFA94824.1 hypothetical protein Q664_00180 [Archangium violaceum Cb vi76]
MLKLPRLDDLTHAGLVEEARALIPMLAPEWTDHNPSDPGITLLEMFAWLTELTVYRLDQVPERSYWTFLKLLNGPDWNPEDTSTQALEVAIRDTVRELRERYRAVTPEDFERLVLEDRRGAGPRVRRAHCVAELNLLESPTRAAPGHVSVVVVPDAPWPARWARGRAGPVPAPPEPAVLLAFDGQGSFVDLGGYGEALEGNLTFSAWLYPLDVGRGRQVLLSWGGPEGSALVLETDGSLSYSVPGTRVPLPAKDTVRAGVWNHAAVTWLRKADASHSHLRLHLGGRFVAEVAVPGALPESTAARPFRLGGTGSAERAGDVRSFSGFISDVCLWHAERTAGQLADELKRPPRGDEETLLACFPCDDGPGATSVRNLKQGGVLGKCQDTWRDATLPLDASSTLLRDLHAFLDQRRLLTTKHHVLGPVFVRVNLKAQLYLNSDALPQTITADAARALQRYLHPLTGGRDGKGWPFGRDLYVSEVYELLSGVAGVAFVGTPGECLEGGGTAHGVMLSVTGDTTRFLADGTLRLLTPELPLPGLLTFETFDFVGGQWRPTSP